MGRLRTHTILLTLGAGGIATEGARADDSAPPPGTASRPQPPVNPSEYVRAGIKLFTKGDLAQATQYFKAANDYRDMLSADDAMQLDAYRARMAPAPSDPAIVPASATAAAPAPVPEAMAATSPAPAPVAVAAPTAAPAGTADQRLGTTDAKQQARWLLSTAREEGRLGHYDEAEGLVAKADSLGVKWGLFDDTPAKVRETIAKVRPKLAASPAGSGHGRRDAQARLKQGRAALASGQFEQAEAIALEINSWGLSYGMLEDNPTKLGNAARALRRREQLRNTSPRAQVSQAVYEASVQQARSLMAAGKFDQAEAKAREALRLNVVPSLTADRAESVLHDIAMAKARTPQGTAVAAAPAAESAAARAEREANALLAKNQTDAAAAKFAEAERARFREAEAAAPKADPAVRQVDGRRRPGPGRRRPDPGPAGRPPLPAPSPAGPGRRQDSAPLRPPTPPRPRPCPRIAAPSCSPRRRPSSPRASTRSPRRWPTTPRPPARASTPRPTSCSPRSPWPSRAGR